MRFCMKCGKPLTEGALFCMNCGAPQKGPSSIPDIPVPADIRQEAAPVPEQPVWEAVPEVEPFVPAEEPAPAVEAAAAYAADIPQYEEIAEEAAQPEAPAEEVPVPEAETEIPQYEAPQYEAPQPEIPQPEPQPDPFAYRQPEAGAWTPQQGPQAAESSWNAQPGWNGGAQGAPQQGGWNQNQPGYNTQGIPSLGANAAFGAGYQNQQYAQQPAYDPYDHTAEFDAKDISDNKVICMLLYLTGIVGLFIALLSQKSEYVSFHVRQSLKLTVLELLLPIAAGLCTIVFGLLAAITRAPGIALIPAVLAAIVLLVFFVVRIIMFFKICAGKAEEAPIARKFSFLR